MLNIQALKARLINYWPPLFFSGIKMIHRTKDYRFVRVRLKLRFWNANYFGAQYGGSIFSMTDPFYPIMFYKNLGHGYHIVDRAATVHYLKLGSTDLYAEFKIDEKELQSIRDFVEREGRMNWIRTVEIKNTDGEVVAEVERTIYIRKQKTQ